MPGFEVRVAVPAELSAGKATMHVQIQANGQTSEPTSTEVQIVDPRAATDDPLSMSPHLISMSPSKVGIGQAIMLIVDRQSLDPDPATTLIVIEQGTLTETLKPERNLALYRPFKNGTGPAVLIARVSAKITGPVDVRVINPSLAEQASKSNAIPLEIADQVLPPKIIGVSDASPEELTPLRQMREASLKAGREFPEYDPARRYVTIRARGLDQNPNFLIVEFTQSGKAFTLSYDDFSLSMSDRYVVRLPTGIKPGPARVTVTNLGAGKFSEPDSITADITAPKTDP